MSVVDVIADVNLVNNIAIIIIINVWKWWIIRNKGELMLCIQSRLRISWCNTCVIICSEQRECVSGHRVTGPRIAWRRHQQGYCSGRSQSRGRQLWWTDDPSSHPHDRICVVYSFTHCLLSTIMGPVFGSFAAVRSALE